MNDFKKFINKTIISFFVLVTLISMAIMILGLIFEPDAEIGYGAFASPVIFAFLGVLPDFVMYSADELSVAQIVIRKIIQILLIEAEVIGVCFFSNNINTSDKGIVFSVALSVLLIFIVSNGIMLINDFITARKITKELIELKKNN